MSYIERREKALLAPYALRSCDSAGRKHPESEHPYRGPFQRDRDRILHSAAFRRLSGKMQVFTGDHGDYHRTRLTHTMEVSSVARTIGRVLRLNEDLIEALALLHDIGHPPFGHAGEDALNECLADDGGFSHNQFALALVEELELRYHDFPGLNLTREVLEGQTTRVSKSLEPPQPLLEAQVVDAADSITYNAHDVDDAIKLGIVRIDELRQISLVDECAKRVHMNCPNLSSQMWRQAVVRELIDHQVGDLLNHNLPFLEASGWLTVEEARQATFVIRLGDQLEQERVELEKFLYRRVYRHDSLVRVRRIAQRRLCQLFEYLTAHPARLPGFFRQRIKYVGLRRGVAEHLAGMTDRFCQRRFEELLR